MTDSLKDVQSQIREELSKIATAVIEAEIASSQSPEEMLRHWKEQLRRLAKEGKSRGQSGVLLPDDTFILPGTPTAGLWKPKEVSLSTIAIHPQTAETGYGFPLALIKGEIVFERKDGKTQLRALSPTFSNSFFLAFLVALERVDLQRIRPCPSCTRVFFSAHGNQEFCSLRCANRERTRRCVRRRMKLHQHHREENLYEERRSKVCPNTDMGRDRSTSEGKHGGSLTMLTVSRYGSQLRRRTKVEARRILQSRLGQPAEGRYVGPAAERMTFEDLAKGLFNDYKENSRRSLDMAEQQVRKHVRSLAISERMRFRLLMYKPSFSTEENEGRAMGKSAEN